MMNRWMLLVAGLTYAMAGCGKPHAATECAHGKAEASPAPALPVLACDEPVYDFGRIRAVERLSHSFWVKNVGQETVWIEVIPWSSGTSPHQVARIEPDGCVEVPTTMLLAHANGPVSKRIEVRRIPLVEPQFPTGQPGN